MKALTIRQPWASLIAAGVKTIETRSWRTSYRGPLAIHAGKAKLARDEDGCGVPVGHDWQPVESWDGSWSLEHFAQGEHCAPDDIPISFGAVVATCTLADVVPIVGLAGCRNEAYHLCLPPGGALLHSPLHEPWPDGNTEHVCDDQLPFGDFTPGRFAWLLTDIEPLPEPVPAKGRQGLWEWTP